MAEAVGGILLGIFIWATVAALVVLTVSRLARRFRNTPVDEDRSQ